MQDIPMIHTSKGNLPLADLQERVVWIDNEQETICRIEHWMGDELVRSQPNIYKRIGLTSLSTIGGFNG